MTDQSVYSLAKDLELTLTGLISSIDIYNLQPASTVVLSSIKKQIIEARLKTRDYELSDSREEQLKCSNDGRQKFRLIQKNILLASEYNLFGPIDVAYLTANIDLIANRLD